MSLHEFCAALSKKKKIECCIVLIELATPIWDDFVKNNELHYVDSVVAMEHEISCDILNRAIQAVKKYYKKPLILRAYYKGNILNSIKEFSEPITAMQDLDWELPHPVERLFYSVYNLVDFFNDKCKDADDSACISMDQSIEALVSSGIKTREEIKAILDFYK